MEIRIPNFEGFYCSNYSDDIERLMEAHEIDEETVDCRETYINFSKAFVDGLNSHFVDGSFNIELKFKSLDSPREYNFRTDWLICEISEEHLTNIFLDVWNSEELQEVLNDHFTPYSGFIPYYSTDMNEWQKEVSEYDHNESMCLLEAFLMRNEIDMSYDNIYDLEYEIVTENK